MGTVKNIKVTNVQIKSKTRFKEKSLDSVILNLFNLNQLAYLLHFLSVPIHFHSMKKYLGIVSFFEFRGNTTKLHRKLFVKFLTVPQSMR